MSLYRCATAVRIEPSDDGPFPLLDALYRWPALIQDGKDGGGKQDEDEYRFT